MSDLEIRELDIRSVDSERRIVSGIAVPYNQVANIGYYNERFAPNSVTMADNVQLFWRHQEPIGKILSSRSTDEGFEITAYISKTARGDEAYTLVRDGVINKFSVGFQSIEDEEAGDNTIVRKKVLLREVSLVPLPAYEGANVLNVRELEQEPTEEVLNELPKENEEKQVDTNTNPTTDLANEVRELTETFERKFEILESKVTTAVPTVAVDNRSAGEILKAVAKQDKDTIALVERAYTGGTTADAVVLNAFVGDLTRIVDEAAVLRNVFSTGALPAEGNYIEYAQLKTNTTDIDYQLAEGDDLAFGKIQQELKTAPVKTLGGYTTLSRQEIERSSVNILDASLRAQAIQAGKALNAQMRVAFKDAVDESIEDGNVVVVPAVATYADWINGIVDATVKFQDEGLSLDALVVDAATFKKLAALEAADGRPLLLVTGNGTNNVGSINVTGLGGSLASVTVVVDPKLTAGYVAFVNRAAIREYTSPVVRLQDENIINLSKDFSVYMYSAVATEIPAAIVAVVDSLEDES
jgi:HK97 family phage prohead protease